MDYKELPFGATQQEQDKHYAEAVHAESTRLLESENETLTIPELEGCTIEKKRHSREEDSYIIIGNGLRTEVIFNIKTKQISENDSWPTSSDIEGSYEQEHQKRVNAIKKHLVPPQVGTQEEMDFES